MNAEANLPSGAVVAAWIRLMRSQQAALMRIERAFRAASLPALAWYDALWELDQAGEAGLRPFEIEQRMLLAQSNISRLIDRLQAAGFVERQPHAEDGRAQIICITSGGRAMRARMWPVYAAAINESIGAHLSDDEAAALGSLLAKLPDTPPRGHAQP